MKKRSLIFPLLFFIGGHVAFLKAMPPKPMIARSGEYFENFKEEEKSREINTRERNRDITSLQNNFSTSQHTDIVSFKENSEEEEEQNEEVSFPDEELDTILKKAKQTQEYWENKKKEVAHINAQTSPTSVRQLVVELEEEEATWEKKQEQLVWCIEKAAEEKIEKLESVINACDTTLNMLREQEAQLSLHRLEVKKIRSYTADSLTTDIDQHSVSIIAGMGALSLTNAKDTFSSQSKSTSSNNNSPELEKKIVSLEEQAKSLRKYAQQCGDCAHQEHRQARNSFVEDLLIQAEDYYQDAILSAKKTIRAWEKSEQAHLELIQVSGQKVRQWGQRLKITWMQRAQAWEQERSRLFQEVEAKKKQNADRPQKIAELQQYINEAQKGKVTALEQGNLADQEERNEIGTTWSVIARKFQGIAKHLSDAKVAYENYNYSLALESEKKAALFQEKLAPLQAHVAWLILEMQQWKEKGGKPYCLENDPSGKSIWKKRFVGSLIRKEKRLDSTTSEMKEIEMAGDYLNIKLKEVETPDQLIELLKNNFPENDLKIEIISEDSSLYALHFKPATNCSYPFPWLDTMNAIQKKIEEQQLAERCYPDVIFKLASDSTATMPNLQNQPTEPWSLCAAAPIGINPPNNLFDLHNPAVPSPAFPILIAILDTGIRSTHQAFTDKIVFYPDEIGEINENSPFGYDTTSSMDLTAEFPRDNLGHGTHVAGIIAGLAHDVNCAEFKIKNNDDEINNTDQPDAFEIKPIYPTASIRGIASMPGMVKLLIVKIAASLHNVFPKNAIKGIECARRQNARILNCSWGIPPEQLTSDDFYEMAKKLGNENYFFTENKVKKLASPIVVIASSGNSGKDIDGTTDNLVKSLYPISFGLGNLISVAATNKKGERAQFSNYGQQSIHVTAPGTAIISASCSGDNNYRVLAGTSMATPHVTASIALMMIKFQNFDCDQLVAYLCKKANKINSNDLQVRNGRLDLEESLKQESEED